MQQIEHNSAVQDVLFFMQLTSDHLSGATGIVPVVTLRKNGGVFAAAAGAVSEVGHGWFAVAPSAVDSNTLGAVALHAEGTGCDPCDMFFQVGVDPVAALLDKADAVEASVTVRNLLRLLAAAHGGKSSEKGTKYRNINDTKDVIAATTNANAERTAMALNLS